MPLRSAIQCLRPSGLAVLAVLFLCGCATPLLDSARSSFYSGQVQQADSVLDAATPPEQDRVLFFMERGLIRQAAGRYEASSADFIEASDDLDKLRTYSVSKGAASMVVNDNVQDYRGPPYERTLLHAFTAKNHLAQAHWDDAAVEARRIIQSLQPEIKGDYPDDAYSRYMAGVCLELIDDPSNAALQYRNASSLLKDLTVDEDTGHILATPDKTAATNDIYLSVTRWFREKSWKNELVCFVMLGRALSGSDNWTDSWQPVEPMYAELYHKGQYLGRSYNLADTVELAFTSDQIDAAREVAKTVGRVVLKEVIAGQVDHAVDPAVGDLVRLVLIGLLERPDVRRWETLPRWLQVARVPCPPDLDGYDVVFKTATGGTIRQIHVESPITRRRNLFVSFCRDEPAPPADAGH